MRFFGRFFYTTEHLHPQVMKYTLELNNLMNNNYYKATKKCCPTYKITNIFVPLILQCIRPNCYNFLKKKAYQLGQT